MIYSEPWCYSEPLVYSDTKAYSELFQISTMEGSSKVVNDYIYFRSICFSRFLLYEITQTRRQRRINIETVSFVNVHQSYFNVNIWLKMNVEPTYFYQRCANVEMRLSFLLPHSLQFDIQIERFKRFRRSELCM